MVSVGTCGAYAAPTFAHEVGHLHGATHNPEATDRQIVPHGYGWCHPTAGWRSVMAYYLERCPQRIAHFTNPLVDRLGVPTGTAERHDVARLVNETALSMANFRHRDTRTDGHVVTLPYFPAADAPGLRGMVRVHNRSGVDAVVEVHGVPARALRGFNSRDLERGHDAWLPGSGLGDGEGAWRLEFRAAPGVDIEVRAYARTPDAAIVALHDAARFDDEALAYEVPFFNPGSNRSSLSVLRVVNPNDRAVRVRIAAWDADGEPGASALAFTLEAQRAFAALFSGALGDGAGKWCLEVSAQPALPLHVLSLLRSREGHVSNLSR